MLVSRRSSIRFAVLATALAACADQATEPQTEAFVTPQYSLNAEDLQPLAATSGDVAAVMVAINQQLEAQGAGYAVRQADLSLTASADPNTATTVFADDRVHRLGYQFVPGDPRRGTVGPVVRQASFAPLGLARTGPTVGGVTPRIASKPAIDAAFATWTGVLCSNLSIVNNFLPPGVFPSAILGFGGFVNDPLASDVNTIGFLPGIIFDLVLGPGASQVVLGVTFPFVFIDANGDPTDIDNNGQDDLAFAEIWYNDAFQWNTTGAGPKVDIETVALHENGHALGLGHFGTLFLTGNGKLHVAPYAVMNAIILGTLRRPLGTDNASFCSYWASWPN
jgi:hypothetical protein